MKRNSLLSLKSGGERGADDPTVRAVSFDETPVVTGLVLKRGLRLSILKDGAGLEITLSRGMADAIGRALLADDAEPAATQARRSAPSGRLIN